MFLNASSSLRVNWAFLRVNWTFFLNLQEKICQKLEIKQLGGVHSCRSAEILYEKNRIRYETLHLTLDPFVCKSC